MSFDPARFEPASGRQLWRLNVDGLLPTALKRSELHTISKQTAWELLANSNHEKTRCPGECEWPRSCALHGCWHLERQTNGSQRAHDSPPEPAAI